MNHYAHSEFVSASDEAGQQIAQLRHVLAVIEEIVGKSSSREDALDEMARIGRAYNAALPIVQRRFDAFAAETAGWAAAGVRALIAAGESAQRPRGAARRLADELERAITMLGTMVA